MEPEFMEDEIKFSRTPNAFQFRTREDDEVRERKGPIPLSEVKEEKITYLWHPYIPMDRVTMIGGDPGAGKSFITGAIAATLSRGETLPGEECTDRVPMNTLMLSAEDDPADTILPRLRNLKADMRRIYVETADIVLDKEGMEAIEKMVEMTNAKLLIIDPIVAYFGSKADMNRANDVRPIMKGLAALARRKKIAILVVRHNRKSSPGQPEGKRIHSGFGSVDFTAAVRSELAVEVGKGDRSYFYHIKMNAGPRGQGIKYWIENLEDDTGLFHWDGFIDMTMKRNGSGISKKFKGEEAAKQWLHDWLKDKPNGDLAKNILAAGMMSGYSQTKLEHVKKEIAFSEKIGNEWYWKLGVGGVHANA
jgi:hypothetical protein